MWSNNIKNFPIHLKPPPKGLIFISEHPLRTLMPHCKVLNTEFFSKSDHVFTCLDVPKYMQVFKHLLLSTLAYLLRKEIEYRSK